MPNLTSPADWRIAVVVPVRRDVAALPELVERVRDALAGRDWRLRLVIDADPEESVRPAHDLARDDSRVAVSGLTADGGSAAAVRHGLAAEPDADAWLCLEGGVPGAAGALPLLVERLACSDTDAVLAEAGTRSGLERWFGPLARLLPRRVGRDVSCSALGTRARTAVLAADGLSVKGALARAGVPWISVRIDPPPA